MKFAGYIGHLWVAFQNSYNDKILLDTRGRSIYMSKAEAKELREKLNVFIGDKEDLIEDEEKVDVMGLDGVKVLVDENKRLRDGLKFIIETHEDLMYCDARYIADSMAGTAERVLEGGEG